MSTAQAVAHCYPLYDLPHIFNSFLIIRDVIYFSTLLFLFESERALGIHSDRRIEGVLLGKLSNSAEGRTGVGNRIPRLLPAKLRYLGKVYDELSELCHRHTHLSSMVRSGQACILSRAGMRCWCKSKTVRERWRPYCKFIPFPQWISILRCN